MIEKIIEWSARNRAIVLLVYFLVCGYGVYTVATLPVDAIPDLSENQVIVFTEYMGRSPQIVEDQVTYPITTALQGLAGVKAVRASSMFGMSFVFVIFNDNVDLYFARNRVQEKLSVIQSQLPAGAVPTIGPDGTGVGHVYWYVLNSKTHDLGSLRAIQDWYVRLKLQSVEGVAEVASIGGFVRQYQVDVSPEKMRAFGISIAEIANAVQRNNNAVGGKLLELNDAEYFVRGQGYIKTKSNIENIVIKSTGNGIQILIRQVAQVQIGGDSRRGMLELDGKGEAVGGIIVMRQGENAQQVIQRVKEKIKEISPGLPNGVSITASYDRSELISQSISTLNHALIESAIVVSIIVSIFLLHFRSVLRIIIEIPVSVLIAFILMRVFNITSNIMSLGGIILAIGVIVDASMVLVENAYRNIADALKKNPNLTDQEYERISINSAKQVGRAIFFSELIILIAFLPVFFLKGQEGKLFHPLVFTKTFMMFGSLVVVITLIPILMTLLMKGKFKSEKSNPVTRFFIGIYEPIIHWVLNHRKTTIALNVFALLLTIPMLMRIGSEFMPPLDEGSILFMPVTLPTASAPEVNRILQLQDQIIRSVPEVSHVLGKAGKAETATDNAPLSMIETIILLKPKDQWRQGITKKDIIAELDSKLQIPGVRNGWTQPIINRINMLATGIRTDIGLKIYGDNQDTLERYALLAESLLKKIDGAVDVVAERNQGGYYLDIIPKQDAIARYGISVGEVQDIIEIAIGGQNIGKVLDGRQRFPIRVRLERDARESIDDLKRLIVPVNISTSSVSQTSTQPQTLANSASMGGGMNSTVSKSKPMIQSGNTFSSILSSSQSGKVFVQLSEVADIEIKNGPAMILSENGMLRSAVLFNARGRDMGSVVEDAKEIINSELKLPVGYSFGWSGQYEQKVGAEKTILIIIPIVFLIIFIMLYLTFKDYKEAGVVMLSVPFALIGGVYMIFALNYNFSVAVWVGFIALYGVAVETGVVMVLYLHEALDKKIRAHQNGERGEITLKDIYDATIEGSVLRLRPKLMTVLTAMIGLVPVMWSNGTGSDVMKPLTAPMIGGLFTSAIHVLIVTPIFFVMMKERALKRGKLELSKMSGVH